MRIKTLFAAILAVGLIFLSGCRQDEDYVLPAIEVKSDALSFDAETEQTLMFTATRDWRVLDAPEWVTIAPDHGSGSQETQRVLVSAEPNSGYNRSGEFTLTIGLAKARIAVSQPGAKGEIPVGSGTLADPYTVAGVLKFIGTLGNDVESPEDVYVKGFVASVTEAFSIQYGNATFTIKEEKDGEASPIFTFYRGLYLGNKKWTANDKQIAVGDEVVICGRVVNFKGNTPETQQNKAYIYSLNGETQGTGGGGNEGTPSGTGTQADPYNAAGAAAAVANLTWTSNEDYQSTDDVYVKGKISRIAEINGVSQAFSAQYGNASFYISEDGSTSGEFYVFRTMYLGNRKWVEGDSQIKVGDEVVICGKLMNYRGNTPETVANKTYLYSLNGETQGSGGGGNEGGEQGGQTTAVYKKVTSIVSGQKYVLLGLKSDKYYVATPLASDKTYGRLNGKEASLSNDQLSGDWASYEFTFTETEGGYTIAMPDGRLLAVDSEHDGTFQIGESYDHVFTVSYSDNQFKIAHKSTGKTIYHGGGTYTNFSCSMTVPDDGTMPMIFGKTE